MPALLALLPFALRLLFALAVLVRPLELRLLLAVEALALPLWLLLLRALELFVLPFELRPLLALDALPLPLELRLLLAPEALLLPFEFPVLFALAPRRLDVVGREVLLSAVVFRVRPLDAPAPRFPPLRDVSLLREPDPFAVGLDLLVPLELRRAPPLLPSFELKAPTASPGPFAVLPALRDPSAADSPADAVRLRPVMSLPIRLAATCATVATPAPAAKPAAAVARVSERLLVA